MTVSVISFGIFHFYRIFTEKFFFFYTFISPLSELLNDLIGCRGNKNGKFSGKNLLKENENQRVNGPINAHLIPLPSRAQNIQNLENIW